MLRLRPLLFALPLMLTAVPASAQRSVAGVDEDDDDDDAAPKSPPKAADDKKADPKKTDGKKTDDKKPDDKKPDDKKADAKKADDKKPTVNRAPDDILEDTDDDKKKRKIEDEARKKAEAAASAADAKRAAEKARLADDKKAAADKKLQATRDQRLSSARTQRTYRRDEGEVTLFAEVAPGAVTRGKLVEVRLEIFKRLDVANPKFGTREPLKNLKLTASVVEPTGKKDATMTYALHSLGAPGLYGFHFTPTRDGVVSVQVNGDLGQRTLNATVPLHVGVWPPPDFDSEDKKLVTP